MRAPRHEAGVIEELARSEAEWIALVDQLQLLIYEYRTFAREANRRLARALVDNRRLLEERDRLRQEAQQLRAVLLRRIDAEAA